MKTLNLTDTEFNRLFEIFEPTYFSLKERVETKHDPDLSNDIRDYISYDIYHKMIAVDGGTK
jgi:hypothetical protein|tara:strand:+ start:44689 stop:44874 length:186 start_codon:yes stop_codon:yes gene_type:complete